MSAAPPMVDLLAADMADQAPALARLVADAEAGAGREALLVAGALLRGHDGPAVLLGSGASHAACVAAAAALALDGMPALGPEAGEFLHYGRHGLRPGHPLVVVSYSGVSAEAVEIQRCCRGDHPVIAVTDRPESPLGREADQALALHCGVEHAVATKSFTNTLALLLLLGEAATGRRPGDRLRGAERQVGRLLGDGGLGERILDHFGGLPSRLDVIGRGPARGTAMVGALVLRELLALPAVGWAGGQYRHGPLLDMGPDGRAIVLAGGRTADLGRRLASDLAARGSRVLLVTDGPPPGDRRILPVRIEAADEALFALLALLPVEAMMLAAARSRGTDYIRIQTESQ